MKSGAVYVLLSAHLWLESIKGSVRLLWCNTFACFIFDSTTWGRQYQHNQIQEMNVGGEKTQFTIA